MAPLGDPHDIHTPDKFREYVEALEVAREFLEAGTPARIRLALIILDNTAEILMYRLCGELFRSDEFHSKILPPRFSKRLKMQVLWKFPEKVRLLKDEDVLTPSDAAVLAAVHSYRNQAVHHDAHNPRGARAIAALMLGAAGRLLARTGRGVMVGGFRDDEGAWLARYGLPTGHIAFSAAALTITEILGRTLPAGLEDVRAALLGDLRDRAEALRCFPEEHLYGPSDADLAEMLRLEEFHATFDEEAIAGEYRAATYAIAQGGTFPRDEFRRKEETFKEALKLERERFRPTLTVMELNQLPMWIAQLEAASSVLDLLEVYVAADRRFAVYESTLSSAARRLDNAIDFQSELERGK
jgi:hypothetical protein